MSDKMKVTEFEHGETGEIAKHKPIMLNDIYKIEVIGQTCDYSYMEITNKDGDVIFSRTAEKLALERCKDE